MRRVTKNVDYQFTVATTDIDDSPRHGEIVCAHDLLRDESRQLDHRLVEEHGSGGIPLLPFEAVEAGERLPDAPAGSHAPAQVIPQRSHRVCPVD